MKIIFRICFLLSSIFSNVVLAQDDMLEFYTHVEQMPEFVGGEKALMHFIESNIVYPEQEKKDKIEGVVYCTFIVNEIGKVINIKVAKGISEHPNFEIETLAMMNKMPDWKPGKQNGKPVSVQYALPIKYALPKK
jgi:protein TonB